MLLVVTLVALFSGGPGIEPDSAPVYASASSALPGQGRDSDSSEAGTDENAPPTVQPFVDYDLSQPSQAGLWEDQQGGEVYLLSNGPGSPLLGLPVGGGAVRTAVSDPVLSYLVTDAWIFYANANDRCIYRLNRDGSLSEWKRLTKPLAEGSDGFTYYNGYLDVYKRQVRRKASVPFAGGARFSVPPQLLFPPKYVILTDKFPILTNQRMNRT